MTRSELKQVPIGSMVIVSDQYSGSSCLNRHDVVELISIDDSASRHENIAGVRCSRSTGLIDLHWVTPQYLSVKTEKEFFTEEEISKASTLPDHLDLQNFFGI